VWRRLKFPDTYSFEHENVISYRLSINKYSMNDASCDEAPHRGAVNERRHNGRDLDAVGEVGVEQKRAHGGEQNPGAGACEK